MFIHVKLREGRDDDITTWYESLDDKSGAVREALRTFIRIQNGEGQQAAIREAVARATAQLPAIVAEAVRDALATYQLSPMQERVASNNEDPELAGRLDAQLAEWGD